MNWTAEGLVCAVDADWSQHDLNRLTLIGAYGFDSSSGFKNPHQKLEEKANVGIFAICIHVCCFRSRDKQQEKDVAKPYSTKRSILSTSTNCTGKRNVTEERDRLNTQVESLSSHRFPLPNGKQATVKFGLHLSMVDGKCLNFLLENEATTRCSNCFLTMGNFNKAADWKTVLPKEHLKHGLGNLHCEIKTMKLLIKLSVRDRLNLRTLTVSGEHKGK